MGSSGYLFGSPYNKDHKFGVYVGVPYLTRIMRGPYKGYEELRPLSVACRMVVQSTRLTQGSPVLASPQVHEWCPKKLVYVKMKPKSKKCMRTKFSKNKVVFWGSLE